MPNKYAVRFIFFGRSRTYIVVDQHSIDALIQALDLLEADIPEVADAALAVIVKAWPDGSYLAEEGDGPLIDTTGPAPLQIVAGADAERVAA